MVKVVFVFEIFGREVGNDLLVVVVMFKCLLLCLLCFRLMVEVISIVGGVCLDVLDDGLMLWVVVGVFCVGEMLDWEVFIGGYLLMVCYVSGLCVVEGVIGWLVGW